MKYVFHLLARISFIFFEKVHIPQVSPLASDHSKIKGGQLKTKPRDTGLPAIDKKVSSSQLF